MNILLLTACEAVVLKVLGSWSTEHSQAGWELPTIKERAPPPAPRTSGPSTHLPTAAREPGQPHTRHIEQPHLAVVVGEGDDFLANTHIDPTRCRRREK